MYSMVPSCCRKLPVSVSGKAIKAVKVVPLLCAYRSRAEELVKAIVNLIINPFETSLAGEMAFVAPLPLHDSGAQ